MSAARIDFHTNPRLIPDDARLKFGAGNDAELVWSTADADNHSLVLALGDSNQALHITDAGAIATDWNVAADTHPTLYVHSNTTPAADYLKIGGHDGTTATIDVVGGTTLALAIGGTTNASLTGGMLTVGAGDGTIAAPNDLILQADEDAGDAGSRIQFRTDGANAGDFTGNDFTVTGKITAGTDISVGDDLLLTSSGAVINFNGGDVTLTHAANTLTMDGGAFIFNEAGGDFDIRWESAGNTSAFNMNAGIMGGQGGFAFGNLAAANQYISIRPGTYTMQNALGSYQTVNLSPDGVTTSGNGDTYTHLATLNIHEGFYTKDGADTIDVTATLRIAGAATEGTLNYALWVVAGESRFDGRITVDDTTAATSTTDGSLQTDGGLSVVGAAVIGGLVTVGADITPDTDGAGNCGTVALTWADVNSVLINGADINLDNDWSMVEAEDFRGYPAGWALTHRQDWRTADTLHKVAPGTGSRLFPAGDKPVFVVTDEFLEYKGRRITPETMDKLLALAEAA